jgi:hypothetical protein
VILELLILVPKLKGFLSVFKKMNGPCAPKILAASNGPHVILTFSKFLQS